MYNFIGVTAIQANKISAVIPLFPLTPQREFSGRINLPETRSPSPLTSPTAMR
jgi:hypothetical protein